MISELELPFTLPSPRSATLRNGTEADLDALMRLLADDPISASRGDVASSADTALYLDALRRIIATPSNALVIVADEDDSPIGTMQLTLIPGMARRGSTRLLVEAVHVLSEAQSGGIGSAMMRWVMDVAAPALGSTLVQLTSDAARTDAHRFYERLGFAPSHIGFKFTVG